MAKQKPSQPPSPHVTAARPAGDAAGTAQAIRAGNGVPAARSTAVTADRPNGTAAVRKQERDAVTAAVVGLARVLGSLQLAVVLLSLFAAVVLLGTLMEHWYGTRIAQELAYRAWWFNGLLLLLAVNIFFAAAKKWPFKSHQTGFVVTHIGLIIMLAGGVLNGLYGTDAVMQLLDTSDPEIHAQVRERWGRIPQASSTSIYADTAMIKVAVADKDGQVREQFQEDFWPGALTWHMPAGASYAGSWLLPVMNKLASPLGRSWQMAADDNVRLEVLNYYPLAQRELFSPAAKAGEGSPAFKLQLRSSKFGMPFERWLGDDLRNPQLRQMGGGGMPIAVDVLGRVHPEQLPDFLQPPPADKLGDKGSLAVRLGNEVQYVKVDDSLDKKVAVGQGGLEIKITRYIAADDNQLPLPVAPGLSFEMYRDGEQVGRYLIFSRLTSAVVGENGRPLLQGVGGNPFLWYHTPELAGDNPGARGVLQFAYTPDKKLYYRAFVKRDERFELETLPDGKPNAGRADTEEKNETPIWGKMEWKFRVLEYLPDAEQKERYELVNIAPGKDTEDDRLRYSPAVQCRLTDGRDSRDFWVQKDQGATRVSFGGKAYSVRYTYKEHDVGFTIKLERAEQTVDPGTGSPASYTSFVQLYDKEKGIDGEHRVITMNEPLEHRGYMFYQSSYQDLQAYDAGGKPVSLTGLTVGLDPGLGLKYRGSLLLGIGIAIMFYMRAYFVKPARKRPPGAEEVQRIAAAGRPFGAGQVLLLAGVAAVLLLYLAIPVWQGSQGHFDAGQLLDLAIVAAVMYCLWLGLDWARALCIVFGAVGGLLLLATGLQGDNTLALVTGCVYLAFAGLLLLPPVAGFLKYQAFKKGRELTIAN